MMWSQAMDAVRGLGGSNLAWKCPKSLVVGRRESDAELLLWTETLLDSYHSMCTRLHKWNGLTCERAMITDVTGIRQAPFYIIKLIIQYLCLYGNQIKISP